MRFYELSADINWRDYGGKWYARERYPGGTEYFVVEFINWEDCQNEPVHLAGDTSRDFPNAYMGPRNDYPAGDYLYSTQVTHFDPSWYSRDDIDSALISSGLSRADLAKMSRATRELAILDACVSYGLGDTSDIRYGHNARKLLAATKRNAG